MTVKAKLPVNAYSGDAAYDLYTSCGGIIKPGEVKRISTGLTVVLPPKTIGLITGRLSLAWFNRLNIITGTVDNTFRGEIFFMAHNLSENVFVYCEGERLAQMVLQPYIPMRPVMNLDYDEQYPTERGFNGVGSSGRF